MEIISYVAVQVSKQAVVNDKKFRIDIDYITEYSWQTPPYVWLKVTFNEDDTGWLKRDMNQIKEKVSQNNYQKLFILLGEGEELRALSQEDWDVINELTKSAIIAYNTKFGCIFGEI